MRCEAIVLAAGQGTRMGSGFAKVLQPLAGRPMLLWSVMACRQATGSEPTLIVPPDSQQIRAAVGEQAHFVEQREPLGTGHAARQAADRLDGRAELVLVTSADMPLLQADTFVRLIELQRESSGPFSMVTVVSAEARSFGRVQRDREGRIAAVVEEDLADRQQLQSQELNVGAFCFRSDWLWEQLAQLPKSARGEYLLTDLVQVAARAGDPLLALRIEDPDEAIGVNTLQHLAEAEAAMRRRINRKWMAAGVRMVDPATTYIEAEVRIGAESVLLPNTYLRGSTVIGAQCEIGPNAILLDAQVGDRCIVLSSVLEGAVLEDGVDVGPFARLRKGARLGSGVHVGNFGEIKNSTLAPGVKVGHFSYLGDATIGADVNIGAGTITCNFDGERKHPTVIGARAFIGSDTMLVAPVSVGEGARTGAGSVVTKDIPPYKLAAGVPARVIRDLKAGEMAPAGVSEADSDD